MPYQRNRIDVKVPSRSGANMSHRNSGTIQCGTLTPLLVEEVIPNTRVHLKIPEVVQLPPLVSDTYMNLKLKHEAFFVPFRILCASFEQFFSDFPELIGSYASSASSVPVKITVNAALPVIRFADSVSSSVYKAGTLLDYLGFKVDSIATGGSVDISPLSLIAYHLIWQEYYRNPRVQSPAFIDFMAQSAGSSPIDRIASFPFLKFNYTPNSQGQSTYQYNNYLITCDSVNVGNFVCADGISFFSLRQRNFGLDWFTGARPSPQQGNPSSVTIQLPSGATETSFTIAQLRAANSLQQFRERNNLPSPRMVDQVRARYGANLSDGVAQRPICIGSSSFDVVVRGVDQTSPGGVGSQPNPFNSVGSNYGKAYAVGNGTLIDDFTANEPGFIMVLQSLVPEVTYSTGVAPYLSRYNGPGSIVDMAVATLQNVGDEPIYAKQLMGALGQFDNTVVAYNDRYGTFMFHPNEVHGLLRDGESLDSFVLQRSFLSASAPTFGTQFLEIPTNYLDQAFVTSAQSQGFAAWYDAKLEWKISTPLAELSLPSLQDPAYEHGQSVSLIRNGQIF